MIEEEEPRPKQNVAQRALDPLGVDELRSYIAELSAEIARAEAAIQRKQGHKSAADSFFRTST